MTANKAELVAQQLLSAEINRKQWGSAMYNVLVEGLAGGGVTDDTAKLQSLVNKAIAEDRKAIFFPHGTNGQYRVTALTNADQVVFFGDNAAFVGGYTGTIKQLGLENNWLEGSVINFIGDSILVVGTTPFPQLVANILKCTANNYGISGDMLSGSSGINTRIAGMNANAKINVVAGGTNDWNWNVPLGTINDATNTTIYGALDVIALSLIANFPNAINVFMSPLKRSKVADAGATNYTLQTVARAMADVAKKYNILFIDNYDDMPNYNPNIATLKIRWAPDGLHPNDAYLTTFFANKVARSLIGLESNTKVVSIEANTPTWDATKLTVSGFTCEKDDNRVITFGLIGDINVGAAGSHILGNVGAGYRPRLTTPLHAFTYATLTPIAAWISTSGDIVILTNAAYTGTLYACNSYRVLNG